MIEKIISGGQSGADYGGLLAAELLSIVTGGTCPAGWRTENGSNPELGSRFNLVCHQSSSYPPRTECNVLDSGATIGFGNQISPGMKLTSKLCNIFGKPYLPINDKWENDYTFYSIIYRIVNFLTKYNPKVLNIAGNRESTNIGIEQRVKKILVESITVYHKELIYF